MNDFSTESIMRHSSIKVAVSRDVREKVVRNNLDLTNNEIDAVIGLLMMRQDTPVVKKDEPVVKKEGMCLRSGRKI